MKNSFSAFILDKNIKIAKYNVPRFRLVNKVSFYIFGDES